ncbi:patatin-like phospholipase family protein [Leifsonia naganoensis]|uniref:NTE family protein n=1 Tax=Leifsonia naganoensis TaxID=150025 RepID=A0A853DS36_9MICO|nr:patatin-like phospholipase family protein [Leifsonia naganoensis]NYK09181.1 NTE family protein [Leifsonia naganoensis]
MTMTSGALVLAGGGVAGIAWETGVLLGLQDAEPMLVDSILSAETTFIGTSAGSTVAAQLAGGTPLGELFERQISEETAELNPEVDIQDLLASFAGAMTDVASAEEARRRVGAIALGARTVAPEARLAAIEARLSVKTWGEHPLLIPAVDTATGDLRVFDRDSGVSLVDAVAASCAVPGVWPPVAIDGTLYMDGGTRTSANADLAAGADRILILVPGPEESPMGAALPAVELAALEPARVHAIFADDASLAAIGVNPLDPSTRPASARAGRELGRRVASQVAAFWN